MALITLTNGQKTLVDDSLLETLSLKQWSCKKTSGKLYAMRKCSGKMIAMHNVVLPVKKGSHTDHINGNTLDNRKANLRECTPAQNIQNSVLRKDNKTGFKGVHWHKKNRHFRTRIEVNGKRISLKTHKTALDAAKAYDNAARKYYGQYARLNFPKAGEQGIRSQSF